MKQALAFVLALALGAPFGAALLEAPVSGRTYVQIDKFAVPDDYEPSFDGQSLPTNPADVLPLPTGIVALLGGDLVDYPGYVAAWVENAKLPVLRDMLDKEGLSWFIGLDASIDMPHRRIDPADPATRVAAGYPASFPSLPIPHRFVVQFAYPVQEVWLVALEGCGGKVIAPLGTRAYLVDATGFEKLYSCPVATYFSWVDAFLTTDRVAPEHLVEGAKGFVLQFAGGTSLANKASFLPSSFNATPLEEPAPGESGFLAVEATSGEIASFALSDPDLLSVTFQGVAEPSDERQGLIVAGRLQPNGTLNAPGYAAWLASRGLATSRNQQVVGVVDSGYDQSQPIEGINPAIIDHHPDLENPERLVALKLFLTEGTGDLWDRTGHGTMVAGIISAAPYLYVSPEGYRGGGRDALSYASGSGISPQSRLAFAKVPDLKSPPRQTEALALIRNDGPADRAFLCNQSWNLARFPATGPTPDGLNAYDATARFFDQRVLDANTLRDGPQELAIVFSAGNFAYRYSASPVRYDTVSSPATAKNVISVGATTSWRPEFASSSHRRAARSASRQASLEQVAASSGTCGLGSRRETSATSRRAARGPCRPSELLGDLFSVQDTGIAGARATVSAVRHMFVEADRWGDVDKNGSSGVERVERRVIAPAHLAWGANVSYVLGDADPAPPGSPRIPVVEEEMSPLDDAVK